MKNHRGNDKRAYGKCRLATRTCELFWQLSTKSHFSAKNAWYFKKQCLVREWQRPELLAILLRQWSKSSEADISRSEARQPYCNRETEPADAPSRRKQEKRGNAPNEKSSE
jgi:hypothetical protein